MQNFSTSPREGIRSLWHNRELATALIKRDVLGRYQGSILGIFWSFFHPLFMLAVYTFVFSIVFQARWGSSDGSRAEFALVLFSGLIVFNFFAECINRSPTLILSNSNYVKKVIFPLEILPCVAIGSAMFHSLVSLTVWLFGYVILFGFPSVTALLLPIVVLPLIFLTTGLSWFLSSLGVYLRDVAQVVTILTTVLMFLSPIFYPASAIPDSAKPLLLINPIAPALEQVRGILMWGELPSIQSWLYYLAGSTIVAWLGFAWFQKTRKGFADVL
ncbi:ABC transporter permease [Nodosilinea sp. E11]|uniref:ABC transporter permease n=1 Tax=Nodosilinea sp. E11 TaxID=3037479 RepID=UPI002934FA3E|nr:ABC transporter permease [Nodosilinea sp. E11]WOD40410.1 ABC transporter permease [Nodosilinea sp. E11]